MSTNGIRTLIKPSTITMETTAAAPLLSTSTTIPPLPSKFASPLPAAHQASHQATPTIVALALAAVVLFAFILLSALLYFTALRVQGRYPNCPCFEGQRNGSQNSGLALITPQRVQERMRGQDIEMGPMDAQAQIYRDRMRMRSLAHLEGQNTATVESETNTVNAGEGETRENEETTLVDPAFSKTHSKYLEQVVAPREAEAKRSLREPEEQAINRHLNVASDPSNPESVQVRAMDRANEMIRERVEEGNMRVRNKMPGPRQGTQSRFKERFSLETIRDF